MKQKARIEFEAARYHGMEHKTTTEKLKIGHQRRSINGRKLRGFSRIVLVVVGKREAHLATRPCEALISFGAAFDNAGSLPQGRFGQEVGRAASPKEDACGSRGAAIGDFREKIVHNNSCPRQAFVI
jgi:hypothetical protein